MRTTWVLAVSFGLYLEQNGLDALPTATATTSR